MVDISKIKVGDKVTVKGKVVSLPHDTGDRSFRIEVVGIFPDVFVLPEQIATHTPAQRAFNPGDRVCSPHCSVPTKWTFVAAANRRAFIAHDNGDDVLSVRLSDLRHADESE